MRKNYYKLFADYCRKNNIWFAVCSNGELDYLTELSDIGIDVEPGVALRFGSKAAYDWLITEYKTIIATA